MNYILLSMREKFKAPYVCLHIIDPLFNEGIKKLTKKKENN